MDKIAIFCSASDNIDPVYFDKARELGTWMGQNGKTLIYGGANIGLMECVARAAKENGSMVMGVVPTKLEADVVVALPGGVGTLDEIFHVMAAATLDYHHKKVIFYNINGFWSGIVEFLKGLETQHFAHHPLNSYYAVADNREELTELLK